jgi:hypothetical protein
LADPTLGGAAADAIGEVAAVTPPRSWPEQHKQRFKSLPYDIQLFVAAHETQREKALRRAQNDAAASRQKLVALEQSGMKFAEGAKNEDSARAGT